MSSRSFIVFDISAEYGHFRKFNTTTSPLSYCIPTPTAITGLLGSILGVEREDSKGNIKDGNESLRQIFSPEYTHIGIRVLKRVNKVNIGFNLLDTTRGSDQSFFNITNRTQIEYELLKNPSFRIYLDWPHIRREELISRIKSKEFHFNPYLGLSQFTADVILIGEKKGDKIESQDSLPFNSAVNLSLLEKENNILDFESMATLQIQVETIPLEMLPNRVISRYGEVMTEMSGNPIVTKAGSTSFAIQDEGNIQLL